MSSHSFQISCADVDKKHMVGFKSGSLIGKLSSGCCTVKMVLNLLDGDIIGCTITCTNQSHWVHINTISTEAKGSFL